jgi:hypothetical protein
MGKIFIFVTCYSLPESGHSEVSEFYGHVMVSLFEPPILHPLDIRPRAS